MDGWGLGKIKSSDAIQNADVPFVSSLYSKYPNTTLVTCGEAVGLPAGQMGNSEVGHLNLGAGRIVYQELERINVAIKTSEFQKNEVLNNTFNTSILDKANIDKLSLSFILDIIIYIISFGIKSKYVNTSIILFLN